MKSIFKKYKTLIKRAFVSIGLFFLPITFVSLSISSNNPGVKQQQQQQAPAASQFNTSGVNKGLPKTISIPFTASVPITGASIDAALANEPSGTKYIEFINDRKVISTQRGLNIHDSSEIPSKKFGRLSGKFSFIEIFYDPTSTNNYPSGTRYFLQYERAIGLINLNGLSKNSKNKVKGFEIPNFTAESPLSISNITNLESYLNNLTDIQNGPNEIEIDFVQITKSQPAKGTANYNKLKSITFDYKFKGKTNFYQDSSNNRVQDDIYSKTKTFTITFLKSVEEMNLDNAKTAIDLMLQSVETGYIHSNTAWNARFTTKVQQILNNNNVQFKSLVLSSPWRSFDKILNISYVLEPKAPTNSGATKSSVGVWRFQFSNDKKIIDNFTMPSSFNVISGAPPTTLSGTDIQNILKSNGKTIDSGLTVANISYTPPSPNTKIQTVQFDLVSKNNASIKSSTKFTASLVWQFSIKTKELNDENSVIASINSSINNISPSGYAPDSASALRSNFTNLTSSLLRGYQLSINSDDWNYNKKSINVTYTLSKATAHNGTISRQFSINLSYPSGSSNENYIDNLLTFILKRSKPDSPPEASSIPTNAPSNIGVLDINYLWSLVQNKVAIQNAFRTRGISLSTVSYLSGFIPSATSTTGKIKVGVTSSSFNKDFNVSVVWTRSRQSKESTYYQNLFDTTVKQSINNSSFLSNAQPGVPPTTFSISNFITKTNISSILTSNNFVVSKLTVRNYNLDAKTIILDVEFTKASAYNNNITYTESFTINYQKSKNQKTIEDYTFSVNNPWTGVSPTRNVSQADMLLFLRNNGNALPLSSGSFGITVNNFSYIKPQGDNKKGQVTFVLSSGSHTRNIQFNVEFNSSPNQEILDSISSNDILTNYSTTGAPVSNALGNASNQYKLANTVRGVTSISFTNISGYNFVQDDTTTFNIRVSLRLSRATRTISKTITFSKKYLDKIALDILSLNSRNIRISGNTLNTTINIPAALNSTALSAHGLKLVYSTDKGTTFKDFGTFNSLTIPTNYSLKLKQNNLSKDILFKIVLINPSASNLSLTTKPTVANASQNVLYHLNTFDAISSSSIKLDKKIVLSGATNHLSTFTEPTVAHTNIFYSLTNFVAPNSSELADFPGLTAKMTIQQLLLFFNGLNSSPNLWLQATKTLKPIQARYEANSGYFVSNPNIDIDLSSLVKHVDTSGIVTSLNSTLRALNNFGNHSRVFTWSNITSIINNASSLNVDIYFSNKTSTPSSSDSSWTKTIPTSTDFLVANRHIWIKFVAKTGYDVSQSTIIDLKSSSNINAILGYVDTSSSSSLSQIKVEGDTNTMRISNEPSSPTGATIFYYAEVTSTNTSGWMNKTDFINWIKTHPDAIRSSFQAKWVSNDSAKYSVVSAEERQTTIDVSDLYNYRDINKYIDAVKNNIKLSGIVNSPSGVILDLPTSSVNLTPAALTLVGLRLQYSLDGITWISITATSVISADPSKNIIRSNNGVTIVIPKPQSGNPKLLFRFISIKDAQLVSPRGVFKTYDDWRSATMVNHSDYDSNDSSQMNYDLGAKVASLPTLVSTNKSDLVGYAISGMTLNASITERDSTNNRGPVASLAARNPSKPNFSNFIKPVYGVVIYSQTTGNNLPVRYWFEKNNFLKWLKGTLGGRVKVWDGNGNMSVIAAPARPDYNNIISYKVKWASEGQYRATDSDPVPLNSSSLTKFISLDTYLARLVAMILSGNTQNPTSATLQNIIATLRRELKESNLDVEITSHVDSRNNVDWSKPKTTNVIPSMTFEKRLAFRIVEKKIGSVTKYFIGTNTNVVNRNYTSQSKEVIWAQNVSTFDSFVDVNRNAISSNVTLSGTTRNIVEAITSGTLTSDNRGDVSKTGFTVMDVWYSLNTPGANTRFMPFEVFKSYLAGTLQLRGNQLYLNSVPYVNPWDPTNAQSNPFGFNSTNLKPPSFDGTWGKNNISAIFKALPGYVFPTSQVNGNNTGTETINDKKPSTPALNRYIDIAWIIKLINNTTSPLARVQGDNNFNWWNIVSGAFNKTSDNPAFNFGGYIDSENVKWNFTAVASWASQYHIAIEWSTKANPNSPSDWSRTLPTQVLKTKNLRFLKFRFVYNGTPFASGEVPELSDSNIHDATSSSKIRLVSIHVPITNIDLSKVEITGTTSNIAIDESKVGGNIVSSEMETVYTLTGFRDLSNNPTVLLQEMNLTKAQLLAAGYKAEMTRTEFITFINRIAQDAVKTGLTSSTLVQIMKKHIKVGLRTKTGYSITQADATSVRKSPTTSGLYTYRDITTFTNQLVLEDAAKGVPVGIKIYGQKTVTNGAVVKLPNDLMPANLLKFGLKIQWSVSSSNGTTLDANADWQNVIISNIAADLAKGIPATQGFRLTITPKAGNQAYLAFRIVPIFDEDKTDVILATDNVGQTKMGSTNWANTNKSFAWYYARTFTKLFETSSVPNSYVVLGTSNLTTHHKIDTSKIPTVVTTKSSSLTGKISWTGDSHNVAINQSDAKGADLIGTVDKENTDTSLKNNLVILYAVDNLAGTPLTSKPTLGDKTIVWLTKKEMEAYLNGGTVNRSGKVYFTGTNTEIKVLTQANRTHPNYNKMNLTHIYARYGSKEPTKFIPSDQSPVSVVTTGLTKYINSQSYLDQLSKIFISGNTNSPINRATSTQKLISAILSALQTETGSTNFAVQITTHYDTAGNPDFSAPHVSINSLPSMSFDKKVSFKIVETGTSNNFFIAPLNSRASRNSSIDWDQNSITNILKYLNASRSVLSTASTLSGDTKNILESISTGTLTSDNRGVVSGTRHTVLDVWYKLTVSGANNTPMPFEVFQAYLNGTLTISGNNLLIGGTVYSWEGTTNVFGFTSSNLTPPLFDGTWGRDAIKVMFKARPGYVLPIAEVPAGQTPATLTIDDVQPNRTALKRYIDIAWIIKLINNTTSPRAIVQGDNNFNWWNIVSGAFNKTSDNPAFNFGGYIDSKNVKWNFTAVASWASQYHIAIEWSTKANPNSPSDWSRTLPTQVLKTKNLRFLKFRFVYNGTPFASGEVPELSDSNIHDATSSSKIRLVSIHVPITNIDLSKVEITGTTSNIAIDESKVGGNIVSSEMETVYTLTGFRDLSNNPTVLLQEMNLTKAQLLAAGYKAEMTRTEFITFINRIAQDAVKTGLTSSTLVQIMKKHIKVGLRTKTGYSITQADATSVRKSPTTSGLYTYRDITTFTNQLVLEDAAKGVPVGIKIYGQKTVTNGAVVKLPNDLMPANLLKFGLKIQWSVSSSNGTTLDANADWQNVIISNIAADLAKGIPATQGFRLTITPKAGNQAYLAFRIVPIFDENKTDVILATDNVGQTKMGSTNWANTNKSFAWYYARTFTKLFETSSVPNSYVVLGTSNLTTHHKIDTSKIPTVVTTKSSSLTGKISWTGDSHNVAINQSDAKGADLIGTVDKENTDKSLKNNLVILYAVDNLAGTPLTSKPTLGDKTIVWLTKKEMEAYLNGGTVNRSGKVYFTGTNTEIKVLTQANRTHPNYNKMNLTHIYARYGSKEPTKFIPSDQSPVSVVTTGLTKYINSQSYLDQLSKIFISGNTNSPINRATSTQKLISAILSALQTETGSTNFAVQITTHYDTAGNPDFSAPHVSINSLPSMSFDKKVSFKIVETGTSNNFFIAPLNSRASRNSSIDWDQNSITNILKYLNASRSVLSTASTLSGDTKNILESISTGTLTSDNRGVVSGTRHTVLDVWYKLTVSGANNTPMPFEVFQAYLNGTLTISGNNLLIGGTVYSWEGTTNVFGFTSSNLTPPLFDGTWGRDAIKVMFKARPGYVLPTAEVPAGQTPATLTIDDVQPNRTALNRYIDIAAIINSIKSLISNNAIKAVGSGVTSSAWWNIVSGLFNKGQDMSGNIFNGYIDTKNVMWSNPTWDLQKYHIVIEWATVQNPTKNDWKRTLPSTINDDPTLRFLKYRFVYDTTNPYTSTTGTGEVATLSDTTIHDATFSSGIRKISRNVSVTGVDLSNIKISGHTSNLLFDESAVTVPTGSEIVYTLTDFINISTHKNKVTLLNEMQLTETQLIQAGYKAEMTKAQFITFINNIKLIVANGYRVSGTGSSKVVKLVQILRNHIKAGLRALSGLNGLGYSLTKNDTTSTRTQVDMSSLYTYREVSDFVRFLKLGNGSNGIVLYGQKTTQDGVVVVLPGALNPTNLVKFGLKLQWTVDSTDGQNINPISPKWNDVDLSKPIKAVAGLTTTTGIIGFNLTITPKNNNKAFLAFRLVPIIDESLNSLTGDTSSASVNLNAVQQTTKPTSWYNNQTKTKLYDKRIAQTNKAIKTIYNIDTSKIPTVVTTRSSDLSKIEFIGDTRHTTIHEDDNGSTTAGVSLINLLDNYNTDSTLKSQLEVLYATDYINGTSLTGVPSGSANNILWLTKIEMQAYLNGTAILRGNNVFVGSSISKALTNLYKLQSRIVPLYHKLNIDHIYARYSSKSVKFIPSDGNAVKITINKFNPLNPNSGVSFRKWIDGDKIAQELKDIIIKGTTENNNSWWASVLSNPNNYILEKTIGGIKVLQLISDLNLKVQYSKTGLPNSWTDNRFAYANYAERTNRKVFIRVIPNGTINHTEQEIYIEYKTTSEVNAPITTAFKKKANGITGTEKEFKLFVDINKSSLKTVTLIGNSYRLFDSNNNEQNAIDEVPYNSSSFDWKSDVEIQYKFDGIWYNKSDLIKEMIRRRALQRNGSLIIPIDFSHNNVKVRWRILDSDNAVIKNPDIPGGDSSSSEFADSSKLKTFVNIWGTQAALKKTPPYPSSLVSDFVFSSGISQLKQNPYFLLTGSVNGVTMKWDAAKMGQSWFAKNHVKVQWSVKETPSDLLFSSDWNDATSISDVVQKQLLNPQTKSLWIRFVPHGNNASTKTEDQQFVLSTQTLNNSKRIIPIKINTSVLRFTVTVDSSKLLSMVLGTTANKVDTQKLFNAQLSKYLVPSNTNPTLLGVTPITVDSLGNKKSITNITDLTKWLKDVGLTIKFRIAQTRTGKNNAVASVVEFETLQLLQDALRRKDVNFDRSTLEISWGILKIKSGPGQFAISDATWVKPTNVNNIINVLYPEDVTTLTSHSYEIAGNNIITNATLIDQKLKLLPSGLKVVYTSDANPLNNSQVSSTATWLDNITVTFNAMPQHKGVWVKFDVTNNNYKLAKDASSTASQITKLDPKDVKVAIVLDANFLSLFNSMTVSGKTTRGNVVFNGRTALSTISTSVTSGKFKYVYSIGQKDSNGKIIWKDSLDAVMIDFYNNGVFSLDKDREQVFMMKLVIVSNKNGVAVDVFSDDKFEFTKKNGKKLTMQDVKRNVNIMGLVQPIFTDTVWPTSKLSLVGRTWKDWASSAKFEPVFIAGKRKQQASFDSFQHDGQGIDSNGVDVFGIGQNPHNPNDNIARSKENSMAPRNSHFEFAYRTPQVGSKYGKWTKTPPSIMATSTNFKTFKVRIVANNKYELPANSLWEKEYNVVLKIDTSNLFMKSMTFIGFQNNNSSQRGEGRIKLNGSTNPNKGEPIVEFLRAFRNKTSGQISTTDENINSFFLQQAYTLEWNVVDSNNQEKIWTDSSGTTGKGWHAFSVSPNADPTKRWGNYPVSLRNGDKVYIRLRANEGWVIIDKNNNDSKALIAGTANYLEYSHNLSIDFNQFLSVNSLAISVNSIVSGLLVEISPPQNFNFKDNKWPNPKVSYLSNGPTINFIGNDGTGGVSVSTGTNGGLASTSVEVEAQWLVPLENPNDPNAELFETTGSNILKAKYGYRLLLTDGTTKIVYVDPTKTSLYPSVKVKSNGWIKNSTLVKNSWWKIKDINKLYVGHSLRLRLVAKTGYAFKWEDKQTSFNDKWVPKSHTDRVFNEASANSGQNLLTSSEPIGMLVSGLTVLPPYEPKDTRLSLTPKAIHVSVKQATAGGKTKTVRVLLTSPYNHRASAEMSRIPLPNDKWEWEYSINGGSYGPSTGNNLKNGDVVRVRVKLKGSGKAFVMDSSFDNTPRKFVISGLKDMIETKNIPKPIMTIGGYQGKGTITSIKEDRSDSKRTASFLKTKGKLDQPTTGGAAALGGVTWEFQVATSNPANMTSSILNTLVWSKQVPTTLKVGDYVRMRVAPKNAKDKVEPVLYSYSKDSNSKNAKEGWIKVINLKIDGNDIGIKAKVEGFIKKTNLSTTFTKNSLSERGVIMQASLKGKNDWKSLSAFTFLENHDPNSPSDSELEFRAIAKPDYKIPDTSENPVAGPAIYFQETKNGKKINYIQLPSWKSYEVKGLKEYINIDLLNFKPTKISKDLKHLPDSRLSKMIKTWVSGDILSGNATVIPQGWLGSVSNLSNILQMWMVNISSVVDINGKPASSKIEIRFIVQKFDYYSGTYQIQRPTTTVPQGLHNNDKVTIRVYAKDPAKYKLSSVVEKTVDIKNLVQASVGLASPPSLTFVGENDRGTVQVSPVAPIRTIWTYQVMKKGQKTPTPYSKQIPINLSNGDLIRVKLISAVGAKLADDYETDWILVSNLIGKIDLSRLSVNPDDIFTLIGKQEYSAFISMKDPALIQDSITNLKIPNGDKLVWKYYVTDNKDDIPNNPELYSSVLPQNLSNGKFIRAILVSNDSNYVVSGFNPISYQVQGLKPEENISARMSIILAATIGTALFFALSFFVIFYKKNKRRKLL